MYDIWSTYLSISELAILSSIVHFFWNKYATYTFGLAILILDLTAIILRNKDDSSKLISSLFPLLWSLWLTVVVSWQVIIFIKCGC